MSKFKSQDWFELCAHILFLTCNLFNIKSLHNFRTDKKKRQMYEVLKIKKYKSNINNICTLYVINTLSFLTIHQVYFMIL